MKTYLVVLGLLLLLKNEVSPLTCFVCDNQRTNLRCLRFRECGKEEVFCVTAVASYDLAVVQSSTELEGTIRILCPTQDKNPKVCWTNGCPTCTGMMSFKKRITKRCSAFCPDLHMVLGFASFGTSCCQQSWCNIWGSLGERNATR